MMLNRGADSSPHGVSRSDAVLPPILSESRTRVVFGAGMLAELGAIAKEEGASNVLLVTDPGIVRAGHVDRAVESIRARGIKVHVFDGVRENPTTEHVDAGVSAARHHSIDFLIGLGGGSSMDCAKGVNFLFSCGGKMADYWGRNKTTKPMLPMIAVPTTAGTGSEAQSFALICDPVTHQKMACGDVKAACRVAILDPDLTATQPPTVASATAIDAVSHAVETAGTNARTEVSREYTREAWHRLDAAFDTAVREPEDASARANMLLGAHLAGAAIEKSMLGAAHSCANPLTARLDITHGVAVGLILPHVVRFNAADGSNPYVDLHDDAEELATRIEAMLETAALPLCLSDCDVSEDQLSELADEAAQQWTARFNPRKVGPEELLTIYRAAYS